ncbi:polyprenyl synthetase family protein [Peptococcaceae bacterium]|nr:polyprenyl synthetase family protein [Peptococcaceae bacterium]
MPDFLQQLKQYSKLINEALDDLIPPSSDYPELIHEAMRYSLMAGGKRLRPALVIGAAQAVGCNYERVLPTACAFELIHTYSLIHDDLPAMDDDDYRRGKPTCHKVYGEAMAILAGNALLTLAFELIAKNADTVPAELVLRVIREVAVAAGSKGLVGGQVVDIVSSSENVSKEVLEYIHRHKTGALLRAAVRCGAILGGADEKQLTALTTYAENLGLAFQIVDDILDVKGDSSKIGKSVGSDEKNKKATYPAVYGLKAAEQKVIQLTENAIKALEMFGKESGFLRSAAYFNANRDF